MSLKETFDPNKSTKVENHTALGHNAVAKAINDTGSAGNEAAPGSTATSLANRIGQLMQQIKNITGGANWYSSVSTTIATLYAKFPIQTTDIGDGQVTQAKTAGLRPAGEISMFAGAAAPTGWLTCDGSSLLRSDYSALFAAIGVTYGSIDGTHFTLPNLKGKIPVGYSSAETEFDNLGETGGEKTHTLSTAELASHNHTQDSHNHTQDAHGHGVSDPTHGHSFADHALGYNAGASGAQYGRTDLNNPASKWTTESINNSGTGLSVNNGTATNQVATATNQAAGSGTAHNNLQPYLVLNYIIKT